MTQWQKNWQRKLAALALGGSLLQVGPLGAAGCYTDFNDYATLFAAAGNAAIKSFIEGLPSPGTDYENIVRAPLIQFFQAAWTNYVDLRIPDEVPAESIVKR